MGGYEDGESGDTPEKWILGRYAVHMEFRGAQRLSVVASIPLSVLIASIPPRTNNTVYCETAETLGFGQSGDGETRSSKATGGKKKRISGRNGAPLVSRQSPWSPLGGCPLCLFSHFPYSAPHIPIWQLQGASKPPIHWVLVGGG